MKKRLVGTGVCGTGRSSSSCAKQPLLKHHVITLGLAAAATLAVSQGVSAATYTWNLAGAGNWNTTTANWTGAGTTWVNGASSDASFNAFASTTTITLTTNIIANSLASNGGSTIVFQTSGGSTLDVTHITTAGTSGSNGSIDMFAAITGNHDLNYSTTGTGGNQGRLNLKAANTYTGDTNLSGLAYITLNNSALSNFLPITTTLNMGTGASTFRFASNNQSQEVAGLTGSSSSATITGLALTGNTFTITTKSGVTTAYAGTFANSAANGLNIVIGGAGTQTFSNTASTYTGTTTINGGTLSITTLSNGGSNSSIGKSANTADKLILNGGTLKYTGNAVSTDRLFSLKSSSSIDASGAGAVNFTNTGSMGFSGDVAPKTLTLTGTNTGSNTIAAAIANNTGATSLTKNLAGTWVLAGANTYTGATTVTAGTLAVSSTGTLSGTSTDVATGATFNLNDNAVYTFAIGATGTVNGTAAGITGTGTAGLNGDFVFNLAGAGTTPGDSWTIVTTSTLGETFGSTFTVANPGATQTSDVWSFTNAGTDYQFAEATGVLSVVPEPTALAMTGFGAMGCLFRRHRRAAGSR